MKNPDHPDTTDLQGEAETRLAGQPSATPYFFEEQDPTTLVHELRVHQIQLEMQNEELRRVNLEIEQQRRRYQNLYDFAPLGYFTLDDQGQIREVNLTGASLLGKQRSVLLGRHFAAFLHPESGNEFELFRRRIIVRGQAQCRCFTGKLVAAGMQYGPRRRQPGAQHPAGSH